MTADQFEDFTYRYFRAMFDGDPAKTDYDRWSEELHAHAASLPFEEMHAALLKGYTRFIREYNKTRTDGGYSTVFMAED